MFHSNNGLFGPKLKSFLGWGNERKGDAQTNLNIFLSRVKFQITKAMDLKYEGTLIERERNSDWLVVTPVLKGRALQKIEVEELLHRISEVLNNAEFIKYFVITQEGGDSGSPQICVKAVEN